MKVNRKKVLLGALLVVVLASGRAIMYSRSERAVFDHSDQFILYSLLPHPAGDAQIKGMFHRNGILGQTQITDPEQRVLLINALYGGIPNGITGGIFGESECFNPRHGIRATRSGRTVDAEICFECGALYFYENGQSTKEYVSHEPQKVFDRILIEANLPLGERPH